MSNNIALKKINPDHVILEFTHDQDGNYFEFEIWGEGVPNESGRISERKLKEYYLKKDYGYWWMQTDDQTDIIDGSTPFESFIENSFDHEIETLLKKYLIDNNLL